jgi:hypothetical protein
MRKNKSYACGVFNGTGAALYVCCGFQPSWVKVHNLESAECETLVWDEHMMRAAEHCDGIMYGTAGGITATVLTAGNGVKPYRGGDILTATSTVYLLPIWMTKGDKYVNQCINQSTGLTLDTWTLDTAGSRTGHWNNECDTTYVGEGSLIRIKQKAADRSEWAAVHSLTSNGEQADEVTLSRALTSGTIEFLGCMYDFVGGQANDICPAGFYLAAVGDLNVSGEMLMFEAGTFS